METPSHAIARANIAVELAIWSLFIAVYFRKASANAGANFEDFLGRSRQPGMGLPQQG